MKVSGSCSWGLKLWLLLHKNLLLRWRLCHCLFTFAEIIFPILASLGLAIMFQELLKLKSDEKDAPLYAAPVFKYKYDLKATVDAKALFGFLSSADFELRPENDNLLNSFLFTNNSYNSDDQYIAYYPDTDDTKLIVSTIFTEYQQLTNGKSSSSSLANKLQHIGGTKSVGKIPIIWKPFDSEADIEAEALTPKKKGKESPVRAAVIFNKDDLLKKGQRTVRYKIRMKYPIPPTTSLFPAFASGGPGKIATKDNEGSTWGDFYCKTGFIGLMVSIDKALLAWASTSINRPNVDADYYYTDFFPTEINMQGFPYPKHKETGVNLVELYIQFIPKLLMIGFICIGVAIITVVISEKETGIKELMKLTGIPNWMHLAAYFINSLWVQIFGVTVFSVILTYPTFGSEFAIFDKSSFMVIWIVLFLYVFASVAFCFFITAFFSSKASIVLAFEVFLWVLTYFAPEQILIIREKYDTLTFAEKMAFCLLPNVGMLLSIRIIAALDGRIIGATFKTFTKSLSKADGVSLMNICAMFIFDIIFYTLFAVYLENILPSTFGVRKPFYYIFKRETWSSCCFWKKTKTIEPVVAEKPGNKSNALTLDATVPMDALVKEPLLEQTTENQLTGTKNSENLINAPEPVSKIVGSEIKSLIPPTTVPSHYSTGTATGFEIVSKDRPIGISVNHLRKTFGKKVSVDDVSVEIYQGDITVLLGHNGAGKSTTISMLTGMFAPTSGTATINGLDINKDMTEIRETLGLCPQQDMLFAKLTCREHLEFFARIKGLSKSEAKTEAASLLKLLELTPKTNVQSRRLSGGQKRKLCLANSLIGNTKVVILDEPSSGMDIQARRAVWDVLLALRGQRTIILVTHFMEEADILGDRIAIMADGKMLCCGSPAFLKRFYGTGYTVRLMVTSTCNKDNILSMVQQFVPTASWKDQFKKSSTELAIKIPSSPSPNSMFPAMFTKLQASQDALGILSIGLSATTIDEVFLRAGQLAGHGIEELPLEQIESMKLQPSSSQIEGVPHDVVLSKEKSVKSVKTNENEQVTETISSVENKEVIVTSSPSMNQDVQPEIKIRESENLDPEASRQPISKNDLKLQKSSLWMMQFRGLFVKRVICSFRRLLLTSCQMLIPIFIVIVAIFLSMTLLGRDNNPPPLTFSLTSYENPIALYAGIQDYSDDYEKSVNDAEFQKVNAPTVQDYLKSWITTLGKEDDLTKYREQYVLGATYETNRIVGMFNTIMYHIAPLAQNVISNSIAKSVLETLGVSKVSKLSEVTTHPLVTNPLDLLPAANLNRLYVLAIAAALFFAFFLPIGFGLLAGTFVILPIEEKLSKGKQLQLMSGVSPLICFLAAFIWDIIIMTIVILVVLCCFPIFEKFTVFTDHGGLYVIFLILWVFGITAILFSYLYTTFATSVIEGLLVVSLFHTIPGMVFTLLVVILEQIFVRTKQITLKDYADVLRVIGRFFPAYGVTISAARFTETSVLNARCKMIIETAIDVACSPAFLESHREDGIEICCDSCGTKGGCLKPMDTFTWEHQPSVQRNELDPEFPIIAGIQQEMVYVVILGIFYLILYFCVEYRLFSVIYGLLNSKLSVSVPISVVEEDVLEEQNRVCALVAENIINEEAFVVDGLIKKYNKFVAVNRLSFAIHAGECFGLLGVNGAGKTTTFRMLTGDEVRSGGNAHIWPHSLEKNPLHFFGNVGYCPQFDGIIGVMTGKEMLTLFARLRGVRSPKEEALKWLMKTGLPSDSGNAKCGTYSGGMKRRLSTAIALIANPPIVLLDEPSSGVDPVSQKLFWKIIAAVKQTGQAVILTSHSLEECENLCSRLGIMVNGQFQCFGGVQHLKSKYAQGYSITISLVSDVTEDNVNVNALNNQILDRFHPAILKDRHQNLLQYSVNNTSISWGFLFENMEAFKNDFKEVVEDYVINEASLEEVFLSFARGQIGETI